MTTSQQTYQTLGNLATALQDGTQAIKLSPTDPRAYTCGGNPHTRAKGYEQAITDYRAAMERYPDDAWG